MENPFIVFLCLSPSSHSFPKAEKCPINAIFNNIDGTWAICGISLMYNFYFYLSQHRKSRQNKGNCSVDNGKWAEWGAIVLCDKNV